MPKYYAVKQGRQTGIYTTWAEAKAQTNGYAGATFKSFSDAGAAESYMDNSSGGYTTGSFRSVGSSRSAGPSHSAGSSLSAGSSHLASIYAGPSHSPPNTQGDPDNNSRSRSRNVIYTDGSSLSNGKSSSRAGWGVYFGDGDPRNTCGKVKGEQTNNVAELTAIHEAVKTITTGEPSRGTSWTIKTDSAYSDGCLNKWANNWERNGWKTSSGEPVKNAQLIKQIRTDLGRAADQGHDITFVKVKGHSQEPGNDAADFLARKGAGFD